jgi:hypothetical protein
MIVLFQELNGRSCWTVFTPSWGGPLQVVPCNRGYRHDWTICPFVHEKEKAKRRPLTCNYTGIACPEMKKVRLFVAAFVEPVGVTLAFVWILNYRYLTGEDAVLLQFAEVTEKMGARSAAIRAGSVASVCFQQLSHLAAINHVGVCLSVLWGVLNISSGIPGNSGKFGFYYESCV